MNQTSGILKNTKPASKSFALVAIIVGVIGVGIGTYSIITVSSGMMQSSESKMLPYSVDRLVSNGSPILGSPEAPVTIVEFGDYQCHNCQRFAAEVKPMIVESYVSTKMVNLIFKDFAIYGEDSIRGASAAHCANEQNRYWEMHDLLYREQKGINSGWLSVEGIRGFASTLSLDMQQFNSCIESNRYESRILQSLDDGKAAGVSTTPTFLIIKGSKTMDTIVGAQPFSIFDTALRKMFESGEGKT
jgi:protein-disulfide isomerase